MKHSLTKICFEILRLYFFNPTLAFSHAGRLRSLIQSQGLRPAISTAKRGLSNFDQDIERIEFEHKLLASFKALYGLARHDPETALRRLKPYLGELVVIDIVHNSYDRLQIASLHILAGNSLFDQEFYSKTYMKGIDKISPADHYMKYGRISGLMPNCVLRSETVCFFKSRYRFVRYRSDFTLCIFRMAGGSVRGVVV